MDFYGYTIKQIEEYKEEDDGFYDDLRRQILQLTNEEEDDDVHKDHVLKNKIVEARKQGPLHGPLRYYDWPGIKEDSSATPAWMLKLWRSGNGTGVFIPQTVQFSGKNRSSRSFFFN